MIKRQVDTSWQNPQCSWPRQPTELCLEQLFAQQETGEDCQHHCLCGAQLQMRSCHVVEGVICLENLKFPTSCLTACPQGNTLRSTPLPSVAEFNRRYCCTCSINGQQVQLSNNFNSNSICVTFRHMCMTKKKMAHL